MANERNYKSNVFVMLLEDKNKDIRYVRIGLQGV